jgi:hypothetical protein
MTSKKELLKGLWAIYSKQKNFAASMGVDVQSEIETMRGWFRSVLEGTGKDKDRRELFGEDTVRSSPGQCPKCGNKGWYWSDGAYFERQGPGGAPIVVQAPGMRACICPFGDRKNTAIKEHAKPEQRGKRGEI